MLKSITLKNYATFIDETTFDFSATNYKFLESTNVGENRILKGALLVGENGSGKTLVLKSIQLLLDTLASNIDINYSKYKSLYTKGDNFSIHYVFTFDKNDVSYEISFTNNGIDVEKLYVNESLKLERIGKSGKVYLNTEKCFEDLNSSLSLVKQEYYNTRFDNDIILNTWFEFLKNSIYLNCLNQKIHSYDLSKFPMQSIPVFIQNYSPDKLNEFLQSINYNSKIYIDKSKEVFFIKDGTNVLLSSDKESIGNRILLSLILPITFATENNCMLLADEFSSGLHNNLEETLIKYFFEKSNNSQIFFTSHSTNLLDHSLLRPDQIYSFEFDSKKGTRIKRFSDENPRESQNIEKMYLSGVFDGLPKYNQKFKDK